MDCLNYQQINEYIEDSLSTVERSMVRDHLIVCGTCRRTHERLQQVEKNLAEPVYIAPPPGIEQFVLNTLFPRIPSLASVLTFLAASFLLLVTGIYLYFDFANNSIVQAFQATSTDTSNWIASFIRVVSTIFSSVYAVFKAMNKFFTIVFNVNIGVEILAISVLLMLCLGYYSLSRFVFKKLKGNNRT